MEYTRPAQGSQSHAVSPRARSQNLRPEMSKPIMHKWKVRHMRNTHKRVFSYNTSQAQSESGYDTIGTVSAPAEKLMKVPRLASPDTSSRASTNSQTLSHNSKFASVAHLPTLKKPTILVEDFSHSQSLQPLRKMANWSSVRKSADSSELALPK